MRIPLVLIHGWGVHSKIWSPILPSLNAEFDITLIDLPGYGVNANNPGDQSLESIADIVLAQTPPRAIWIGWSLGGTIALAAALRQPERLLKLQLISSTPRFLNGNGWDLGVELAPFERLARQFDHDYAKGLKRFLLLQSSPTENTKQESIKSFVREMTKTLLTLPHPTLATLQSGLAILKNTDLRSRLSNIKIESQIIAGSSDTIVPVGASQQLALNLPHAHFHQLNTGHLPFLDATNRYLGLLREFAKGVTT